MHGKRTGGDEAMTPGNKVLLEIQGSIALIKLNKPDRFFKGGIQTPQLVEG